MTYITENCKIEIETKGDIENIIGQYVSLSGTGKSRKGDCPFCSAKKKFSVTLTGSKANWWGCWSDACGVKGQGYVSFVKQIKGIKWIDALKFMAEQLNINLEYQQMEIPLDQLKPGETREKKEKKAGKKSSFRDQQLADSGLTDADQKYLRNGDNADTTIEMDRYQAATLNDRWEIIPGDDMILHYMDLFGDPMKFHRKGTSKDLPFFRIRYQHPNLHPDKDGEPVKYRSPFQSGSRIWVNQTMRNKFKERVKVKTLSLQEGEKKADKCTKHGLLSFGIAGIHNVASDNRLPHEFELFIKQCEVEEVIFFVDADFCDIGKSINKPVDERPRSFVSAIMKFRKYFYALNTSGIHLQIYFAYVRKEHEQKGTDDLLHNTLKGEEDLLLKDLQEAKLHPQGQGKYINCHNITSYNEFQLKKEFFHMENNDTFAKFHLELLKERKVFMIGREKFKINDNDKLELAQPISHEMQFWEETPKKKGDGYEMITSFKYVECCMFLQEKKFGRYSLSEDGEFNFIKVEDNVVRVVKPSQIKDYLMDFTRHALQKKNVLEMLYKGAKMYLSDNLTNLDFINLNLHRADKGLQFMYFSRTFWKITSEGIEEKPILELDGHVWKENIKDFNASLIKPIVKVNKKDGKYSIEYPSKIDEAKKCVFYNYLINTSNFHWRTTHEGLAKTKGTGTKRELNDLEMEDLTMHFISKCCALGFMVHEYFDANRAKAVIAMDGKISAVGDSNGRSGKSLFSKAISFIVETFNIPGKQKDLAEDKFLFDGINERTRVVNIDDVRVNFDFEHFFSNIGGEWRINPKGGKAFKLDPRTSPKIIISTNHALNGEGGSFRARQYMISFSDFYNEKYQPVDEHGHLFFSEWIPEQWNRFYNFIANCVQIYFEHGLVEAPMENLEKRRIRQQMGESFLEWAETYYDPENTRGVDNSSTLNNPIDRKELLEEFYKAFPEQRHSKYMDTRKFKTCIKKFCQYKGYVFNPGVKNKETDEKDGGKDSRNSIEYFTVFAGDFRAIAQSTTPSVVTYKEGDDLPY